MLCETHLLYLNAVCQETLRIYRITVFTFARVLRVPMEPTGYQFEAGTLLSPCMYLTHNRPDLYPEPKQFRPERFLERQFSPYEYFPFGGSNRRYIGIAFAQYEMQLLLATVLRCFQLKLANQRPVRQTFCQHMESYAINRLEFIRRNLSMSCC